MAGRNLTDTEGEKENRVTHSAWPARRLVEVPRAENGFGFTLRHFIVYPPDASRPGTLEEEDGESLDVALEGGGKRKRSKLSMTTPSDPMDTIFVKQVKEGGPAHHAGLRNGDRIVSVNGESVTGKTYSQVIALIQASDASLKLLVVPKDEDVLQMAYETSVYKQGQQDPYRGQASHIPEPPGLYPQGHPLVRSADQNFPSFGRSNHGGRFKSELVVGTDEGGAGQRVSLSSISSNGSVSAKEAGSEGGDVYPPPPLRTSSKNFTLSQLCAAQPPLPYSAYAGSMDSISRSSDASSSTRTKDGSDSGRDVQQQRGSLDVRLGAGDVGPSGFGSQERLLRTSNESTNRGRHRDNLRRSSDDLMSGKSSCSSSSSGSGSSTRLPFATRPLCQPPPYCRSKTTSSITSPAMSVLVGGSSGNLNTVDSITAAPTSAYVPSAHSVSAMASSSSSYVPNNSVLSSRENLSSQQGSEHDAASDSYGLTVTYQPDQRGHKRTSASEPPASVQNSTRHSVPERQMVNLVTERMKKFESSDSVDGVANRGGHQPVKVGWGVRSITALPPKYGHDSVSSRTAQFECMSDSNDSLNRDDDRLYIHREQPSVTNKQTRPPSELHKVPPTPPATISLYFRSNEAASESQASLEPSPERTLSDFTEPHQDSLTARSKPASRKPSYLSAVESTVKRPVQNDISETLPIRATVGVPVVMEIKTVPQPQYHHHHRGTLTPPAPSPYNDLSPLVNHNNNQAYESKTEGRRPQQYHSRRGPPPPYNWAKSHTRSNMAANSHSYSYNAKYSDLPPNSSNITTTTTTSTMTTTVALREPLTAEERDMRLVRRTSYLMATGRQHGTPSPLVTSAPLQQQQPQHGQDLYSAGAPPPSPSARLQTVTGSSSDVASLGEEHYSVDSEDGSVRVGQEGIPLPLSHTPSAMTQATPAKTSNIKKLKAFFGERTPRIVEAAAAGTEKKSAFDIPSPVTDIILQTTLNCKVAITDGKRASDRSWKPMWAVLRALELHLYKDKNNTSPSGCEEQPISTKGALVDIAFDYTKKKHVFRLTTQLDSEYLFQADDEETMLQWIKAIQTNSADGMATTDKEAISNMSSVSELTKPIPTIEAHKTSPQVAPKSKKTSSRSLRSKSPASHSPAAKPRKQLTDRDYTDSPKPKEQGRTWKVKMANKFKRNLSSSSASADVPEVSEVMGTFNVPIDMCPTSSYSENVPFVVEICTTIVESKGLNNQGIYRVPGNTGSVNMLQQELDRDGDGIDLDNEKWQDVNVVSSLLKLFFRKLPEPLVTDDLYDAVINANRTEHPEKRMLKLKKLLHDLPETNFETFRLLANHLHKVSDFGELNKMDARNLAIVFGPTLIRPRDDSMVLMVRDMSDQCRIIESIITHSRWFFSSWDEDVNVPVDMEGDSVPVSGMNQQLLEKAENLELGDRGRDTSAKDLMSSFFNKKMRKKDKTTGRGGDSVDAEIEADAPSYNERNIDREIELRRVKETTVPKDQLTLSKEASSSSLSSGSALPVITSSLQMSTSSIQMSSSMIQERPKYERKDSVGSQSTSAMPVATTEEETLKNRTPAANLEVKRYPAYPSSSDFYSFSKKNESTSYSEQQHLKRLEYEAKALRERDLQEERHQEELVLKRQLVEAEMARTKRELDEDSDVDICSSSMRSTSAADALSDTRSLTSTSDYSTMTSTGESYRGGFSNRGNQENNDKPAVPVPTKLSSNFQRHNIVVKTPTGRRYMTTAMAPMVSGAPAAHDDIELCRQNKHTASSSVKFDMLGGAPVKNVGVVSGKMKPSKSGQDMVDAGRDITLQRVPSIQRKGSLDSLLDTYNDPAGNSDLSYTIPHPDSDSSEDLLESIAATDLRFKKLLLSDKNGSSKGHDAGRGYDRPFQDPSLHRIEAAMPVVGIASRFERKESTSSSQASGDQMSASSSPKVAHGSPASLKASSGGGPPMLVRRPMKTPPKSSPKTDLSRKPVIDLPGGKDYSSDSGGSKSATTLYESCESFDMEKNQVRPHAKSASPALRLRHDAKDKRERRREAWRRHTVGGVVDLEQLQAIIRSSPPKDVISSTTAAAASEREEAKVSAWERLQPAVKNDSGRDLQCWLAQQQRLRRAGSSPALLDEDYNPPPPHPQIPNSHPPPPRPRAFTMAATANLGMSHSSPTSPAIARSERPQTFTFESSI